ncbi:MAG: beta-class carbonic anhydrase, partial [Porticoccaceae bacterium]
KPTANNNLDEILKANSAYAQDFDIGHLASPPARHFAVLTCMDARMDPAKIAGLSEGDAHVIRNAGGRASDDAIRSLIISHKFLGTTEWFVIQHTGCGMATVTDAEIAQLLEEDLETAVHNGQCWENPQRESSANTKPGSDLGHSIHWHTIADLQQSVLDDVKTIQNHPLVPSHIRVHGFIYDVKTGQLGRVSA